MYVPGPQGNAGSDAARIEEAGLPPVFRITPFVQPSDLAGAYDVMTAEGARSQGHATLAGATLPAWAAQQGACTAYLQVDADNGPAIARYRRFGLATLYTYHFRGSPGASR